MRSSTRTPRAKSGRRPRRCCNTIAQQDNTISEIRSSQKRSHTEIAFYTERQQNGGPTVAAATMQAKSTQNSLGSISILLVRLNFGQRLRASRKAPIQYSACAKRAHIFSSESSVWRGRPRTNLATWRRSFPLAIDGSQSAHHVAKVAKVSNAVARVGPQSRRLGTAPRGCLRWRCHNFVHTPSDPGRNGGSVGALF